MTPHIKVKELIVTAFLRLGEFASIRVRKADGSEAEVGMDAVRRLASSESTMPAGVGITDGVGAVHETGVQKIGGTIITRILLDLTGLNSSGTLNDVIGEMNGGAAYLGQITEAMNGTIIAGTVRCLEVPTGGDPDVDFWAANEDTGEFSTLITSLTGEAQLINTGDWTLEEDTMIALPADGQYLYATAGATDNAKYTAGKFLITLYGI